jgi:hypothetical protein
VLPPHAGRGSGLCAGSSKLDEHWHIGPELWLVVSSDGKIHNVTCDDDLETEALEWTGLRIDFERGV